MKTKRGDRGQRNEEPVLVPLLARDRIPAHTNVSRSAGSLGGSWSVSQNLSRSLLAVRLEETQATPGARGLWTMKTSRHPHFPLLLPVSLILSSRRRLVWSTRQLMWPQRASKCCNVEVLPRDRAGSQWL